MKNMRIDWDVPIAMDDGLVLRADVFRPSGRRGAIRSSSATGLRKGLAFQDGYPSAWQRMVDRASRTSRTARATVTRAGKSSIPEKWVPEGYVCVRVDSRGAGRSPGYIDHFSPRETQRLLRLHRVGRRAALVERQGRPERHLLLRHQPVARRVAAAAAPRRDVHLGRRGRLVPRHDPPRRHPLHVLGELVRHAGEDGAVRPGRARRRAAASPATLVCGDETLSDRELQENRCDFGDEILAHPLDDDYHKARSPHWDKVTVPFLSAANWGGQGLHPRGNFEGFVRAASKDKWLEGARHRALDALLHRLRRASFSCASSTIF